MGQAKQRKQAAAKGHPWPQDVRAAGKIELHMLDPDPEFTSDRLRELGDLGVPPGVPIIPRAHRAVVAGRTFLVGFCVGNGQQVSPIGHLVVERMLKEMPPDTPLHVVPISDKLIVWDLVLRHLRTFAGDVLLFAFSDSEVYDAGTVETHYSPDIVNFKDGKRTRQLDDDDRAAVRKMAAEAFGRKEEPLLPLPGVSREEIPPVFQMRASNGKNMRMTVWNGRKDFIHELPKHIINLVGGDRIAVVQVDSPVGVDGRSSVALSDLLAESVDGIIHWARDVATYQSIVREFILGDVPSTLPPVLPADWSPEIILMPVNDGTNDA